MDIPIIGGSADFQRRIRAILEGYPSFFVRAARISKIVVTSSQDVREQIAIYQHGSREMLVYSGCGDILRKAIGHELAHGCDDNFDHPHFFTSVAEWNRIHHNQSHFDMPKYRDEALEYFADCFVKFFLVGPEKFGVTHPDEVTFLSTWVVPTLRMEFEQ